MPSNHLILCRPVLLLPSIFPSIRVFSNESVIHIRWPKYWSFSFTIIPSNEYSVLISFRIDWFDLLPGQGTIQSLQHHSSKALILWCSAFFIVQLLHPCMTTGKIIVLTIQTFVSKMMSLLFNMLTMFVRFLAVSSFFKFHGCSHHLQWYIIYRPFPGFAVTYWVLYLNELYPHVLQCSEHVLNPDVLTSSIFLQFDGTSCPTDSGFLY